MLLALFFVLLILISSLLPLRAAELGNAQAVSYLLADGADGRAHPITNYCPLYIACYRGHVDVAALLLAYFPTAAQVWILLLYQIGVDYIISILRYIMNSGGPSTEPWGTPAFI